MGRVARLVHVHVVNDPDISTLYHVSPEQFRRAFRRTPAILDRIKVTVGLGSNGFDESMHSADVLIAWQFPRRNLGNKAPRLTWIHGIGAGIDHWFPLDWLPSRVILTNSSGAHVPRAGESIACALLMLNDLIPHHVTNQRAHKWEQVFTSPIRGKTLAIVGVGKIGGEGARRAKQLGLRVVGVRRSGRPHRHVDRMYGPDRLRAALAKADFVLLVAPLTSETHGLLGREELDLLKPTVGIINMGRAGVVDYEALIEKLNKKELAGAILDVFDPEPLPADSALWECRNLVVTPHVSSDSLDYTERMLGIFAMNLRRFLSGRPLRNRIEPARQY